MDSLKSMDKNDLLGMLGLQMKTDTTNYALSALAIFSVGLVVGASLGVLFAPKAGTATRQDISRRIQEAPEAIARLPERAAELTHKAAEAAENAREQVRDGVQRMKNQTT